MGKIQNDERTRFQNKNKACMIEDRESTVCVDPSLPLLSLIGKKYTMMILGVIGNNGNRKNFNEILRDIPYSSSTIISSRLKELQDLHLIQRREETEGVNYSLTEFGRNVRESLLPLLRLIEQTSLH
ncbi:winged helix-turn-helix transcriptional regulator [Cuniculiplasma divulgatum]|uniref:HxlR family transcriptional regulator n=1 Tax=Cuniculiplasma divulgatum TaxID=1673428 RepID=A0A1N5S3P8_9ARCH|nr:helix-turn-helix domain-containing protein [Cuniculiplasma divulgatum]SIM30751.1 HxlR family transcriptional regulator [Cuniculiplasma divulgatum]